MSGGGFNPFARTPRTACPDCGAVLVFDAAAVPLLAPLARDEALMMLEWRDAGGSLYGCRACGLVGAWSPMLGYP